MPRGAADLEATNHEREACSDTVSHDLRTPLSRMGGVSQALLEDAAATLEVRGQDDLQRIRAATPRMADLIDALRDWSHVSRAALVGEAVDLSALARALATDLPQWEPTQPVEFVMAAGLVARGDARGPGLVLEHLFSDAWTCTATHPQARLAFGGVPQPDGARVGFVRDDGVGFDMAQADQLCSASFSACMGAQNIQAPGSAWRPCSASISGMAVGSGPRAPSGRGPPCPLPWRVTGLPDGHASISGRVSTSARAMIELEGASRQESAGGPPGCGP